MSFELDLNLGEAFAQIKGKGLSHTWYQPRRSLVDGLKDALGTALSEGGTIRLISSRSSDLPETPATAAALVTTGFENSCREFAASTTFPSSARICADGSERVALNVAELTSLADKLDLSKSLAVAICFLHSREFPGHELQAAQLLNDRRFTVFTSHSEEGSDVERFAKAMKKAAHFAWLSETAAHLQDELAALGPWTVAAASSTSELATGPVLHLGLEKFSLSTTGSKPKLLRVQPSQRLVVGPLSAPTFEPTAPAFGSGPMFLGRSFHPTVLDLLFMMDHLDGIELLKITQGPRLKSRITEMILTLAKDIESEYRIEARAVAHDLQALALELISSECMAAGPALTATGDLAPALVPLLLKHRKGLVLKISDEAVL